MNYSVVSIKFIIARNIKHRTNLINKINKVQLNFSFVKDAQSL